MKTLGGASILGGLALSVLSAFTAVLAADYPQPIVVVSAHATDPSSFGWLSDDGRKALSDLLDRKKSGSLAHFAFVAAPNSSLWAYQTLPKPTAFFTTADIVRGALENCELSRSAPCVLVSLDGLDATGPNGDFPIQPSLLQDQPLDFDLARVPFVTAEDRADVLADYPHTENSRALFITTTGYATWQVGDDIFTAIAKANDQCVKDNGAGKCILYAINNHVAYDPLPPSSRPPSPPLASPIVNITNVPTDPNKFAWLEADPRKSLTQAIADKKAGKLFSFAFAVSPSGKSWEVRTVDKEANSRGVEDLARTALQSCEYDHDAPCLLLSVDGFNAGLGRGPQLQPSLLRSQPKYLDFGRIPFLATEDAPIGYGGASEPKVLAVTQDGDFHWDNDDKDVTAAIAKVAATCKKNNEACVLYAIGDRVVWSPDDEQ